MVTVSVVSPPSRIARAGRIYVGVRGLEGNSSLFYAIYTASAPTKVMSDMLQANEDKSRTDKKVSSCISYCNCIITCHVIHGYCALYTCRTWAKWYSALHQTSCMSSEANRTVVGRTNEGNQKSLHSQLPSMTFPYALLQLPRISSKWLDLSPVCAHAATLIFLDLLIKEVPVISTEEWLFILCYSSLLQGVVNTECQV